jgi:hypothetical protein
MNQTLLMFLLHNDPLIATVGVWITPYNVLRRLTSASALKQKSCFHSKASLRFWLSDVDRQPHQQGWLAMVSFGSEFWNSCPQTYLTCFQALVRGTHRGTFLQYSSYSAPNVLRSVGSSYSSTNKVVPITAADAIAIATRFARPKTTQSPPHPTKNPKYIGFRTYRYDPTTTSLFGGAIGAGVPSPVQPKSHTHCSAAAKPSTEGTPAIQRHRAKADVSVRKPSQDGSNQNHSAKNAAPTASDVTVVSQRAP